MFRYLFCKREMELHLRIIGWLLLALSVLHLFFPRYFNWKEELERLQLINKQMMQVHTLFVVLVVILMGLLCLVITPEEVGSPLGSKIMLGFGVFWLVRLAVQFFWYSPKLWKGKTFETGVHLVFSMLWLYLTIVFFVLWRGGV